MVTVRSGLPTKQAPRDPAVGSDDRCLRFLAGEMRGEVGQNQLAHGDARLDGCASPMRLQDDSVECPQRLRHVRLIDEDVETGPPRRPSTRAETSACSSMTLPRATLTRIPSGPSAFSTEAPTSPRDWGPPAAATMRKSESRASASNSGS